MGRALWLSKCIPCSSENCVARNDLSDIKVSRKWFCLLVDLLDLFIYVKGCHERLGRLNHVVLRFWILAESLPIELSVLDLLNLELSKNFRIHVKAFFSDHGYSYTVFFVNEISNSMPLSHANSSFPAVLFLWIHDEPDIAISVQFVVVNEFSFQIISIDWIHQPSHALGLAVYHFSVVDVAITVVKDANSLEMIVQSFAYHLHFTGSCLTAKTSILAIDELSFERHVIWF